MQKWVPADGDIFVVEEGFVFYTFGYDHPGDRVISFLKYIPSKFDALFPLRFLTKHWSLKGQELLRPERLYSQENYLLLLETFRNNFPRYLYSSPYLGKVVIAAPLDHIKSVFVPGECLQRLLRRKNKDPLQKLALELIRLFSERSGVNLSDFGIHGSIALNMHTIQSDIDFVVYGAENFRALERTIAKLVDEGAMNYIFNRKSDIVRRHHGKWGNQRFVYTAIRNSQETYSNYGEYKYQPIRPLTFLCEVVGDNEAMFRPAIYSIANYQPLDPSSVVEKNETPRKVVSMLGCYRNMARVGDKMRVSGILEKAEKVKTWETHYQVVVGTATRKDESIQVS